MASRDAGRSLLESFLEENPEATRNEAIAYLRENDATYRRQDMLADYREATGQEAHGVVRVASQEWEEALTEHRIYGTEGLEWDVEEEEVGIPQGTIDAVHYYNPQAYAMYGKVEIEFSDGTVRWVQTETVRIGDTEGLEAGVKDVLRSTSAVGVTRIRQFHVGVIR